MIKIDVEGFEYPVIEGAICTLENPALKAVIMELNGSGNRYGFDEARILQSMFDRGFDACTYDPFRRKLIKRDARSSQNSNTLFVRDLPFVRARLEAAEFVDVHGLKL